MWLNYYRIFVMVVGLFYLLEFIPGNILKKLWGEIPLELIGTQFQNGTFSQVVMSILFLYVIFK
ncbi:hypothetical protein BET01_18720 [Lacrimispora algidixylanolytica]|uniref:Uncharacterized protein n=1 Tax=Lacrimispora algidixylanolytica TaxID=94868 RepID=A0A419T3C2_9FIRM|nr:hypothetical protein BET01_18720 [Lacrimispora algidixylanolytica]